MKDNDVRQDYFFWNTQYLRLKSKQQTLQEELEKVQTEFSQTEKQRIRAKEKLDDLRKNLDYAQLRLYMETKLCNDYDFGKEQWIVSMAQSAMDHIPNDELFNYACAAGVNVASFR